MKRSVLISICLASLLAFWMISGPWLGNTKQPESNKAAIQEKMLVSIKRSQAKSIQQLIISNGQAVPDQEAELKAEITGTVKQIFKQEGDVVKKGQPIIKFDMSDRQARLFEAKARVEEQKEKLKAMSALHPQGYSARTEFYETKAEFEKAKAALLKIQIEIDKTNVIAPFDGKINQLQVEIGDYLTPGKSIGQIINNNPLIIELAIAQQDINKIKLGQAAGVNLATGAKLSGTISFIASRAEPETRTFEVNIKVNNTTNFRSGVSAQAIIPTEKTMAHFISPALLSLNSNSTLGVKSINDKNIVTFIPVKIIRTADAGVWITGLPDKVNLISDGQGFVNPGEEVSGVMENNNNEKTN